MSPKILMSLTVVLMGCGRGLEADTVQQPANGDGHYKSFATGESFEQCQERVIRVFANTNARGAAAVYETATLKCACARQMAHRTANTIGIVQPRVRALLQKMAVDGVARSTAAPDQMITVGRLVELLGEERTSQLISEFSASVHHHNSASCAADDERIGAALHSLLREV